MDRMDADEINGKKIVMDTTSKLLSSPTNARRLRDAIASFTPEHLVFETTEDLKRELGI